MKNLVNKLGTPKTWLATLQTRRGFFWWLVILFWAKTLLAYGATFGWLHATDIWQVILMLANPLGFSILMLSVAAYLRPYPLYYGGLLILDAFGTLLLYLNVVYYREFSDYMTVNTMLGYKTVNQGTKAAGAISFNGIDVLFWADIIIFLILLLARVIKAQRQPLARMQPFFLTTIGTFLTVLNLFAADIDRPQLLTRQFDREYLVKYLGLGPFTVYDAITTQLTAEERKKAQPSEIDPVKAYVKQHQVPADVQTFGTAKGKNVIVIHLESFQQFLIDRKVNGKEITPFLNSIYHSSSTYAFDNFFNQVGQGKTSDAENLMETSTFGTPQGSLFSRLGTDQTFQAMPAILNQTENYSSAVFHGNTAAFWNRNMVYKQMGYQNFFSADYFDASGRKATDWGLKDKLLFADSVPYLEQLQQPFYVKYLTVTNHTPYTLDKIDQDPNFTTIDTGDKYLDNYVLTAHYLDQSIKEFFTYLKKSGVYNKSMIVLYGDHYGIPNSESKYLATLLGKDPDTWNAADNAQMQRVPFMINIPGQNKGGIQHTYGGEVDAAPTIEHLLGVNTSNYLQFGQDLLRKKRSQVVAFRNKDFVTPDYTVVSGDVYDKNEQLIANPDTATTNKITALQNQVDEQLAMSDTLNSKNLLRFYTPKNFKAVDSADYDYSQESTLKRLQEQQSKLGVKSTSLLSQNNNKTTATLYKTDAPEWHDDSSDSTRIKPTNPDDWAK